MHELTDCKFAPVEGRVCQRGMVEQADSAPGWVPPGRPDLSRTERRCAPVYSARYQDKVMLTSMLPRVAFE